MHRTTEPIDSRAFRVHDSHAMHNTFQERNQSKGQYGYFAKFYGKTSASVGEGSLGVLTDIHSFPSGVLFDCLLSQRVIGDSLWNTSTHAWQLAVTSGSS